MYLDDKIPVRQASTGAPASPLERQPLTITLPGGRTVKRSRSPDDEGDASAPPAKVAKEETTSSHKDSD